MKRELVPDASNLLPELPVVAPAHGQAPWEVSDIPVFWPKRTSFPSEHGGC